MYENRQRNARVIFEDKVTTFFWTWRRLSLFVQSNVCGIYVVGTLAPNMKNGNYSHLHRVQLAFTITIKLRNLLSENNCKNSKI